MLPEENIIIIKPILAFCRWNRDEDIRTYESEEDSADEGTNDRRDDDVRLTSSARTPR